jgi:tetratricopeptide (TPR) repeat protein
MKGLVLYQLKRHDEARQLSKQGVKENIKSHVCWHVQGIIYRCDRNYEEAVKSYQFALRFDKDNLQILRDLAAVQIQLRQYNEFQVRKKYKCVKIFSFFD